MYIESQVKIRKSHSSCYNERIINYIKEYVTLSFYKKGFWCSRDIEKGYINAIKFVLFGK